MLATSQHFDDNHDDDYDERLAKDRRVQYQCASTIIILYRRGKAMSGMKDIEYNVQVAY